MKKNQYIFKPLDNIHAFYMLIFLIVFGFVNIVPILTSLEVFEYIIILSFNAVIALGYFLTRFFFPVKYVIKDDYLIKYSGKNILFKIRIGDIKEVHIKKAGFLDFFHFLYEFVCGSFTKTHGTCISIAFEHCEIQEEEKHEIPRMPLLEDNYKHLQEIVEIFSYRKCIRLCEKMEIKPNLLL